MTGFPIRVGATFNPEPEFAVFSSNISFALGVGHKAATLKRLGEALGIESVISAP